MTEAFDFIGHDRGAVEVFFGHGHVEEFLGVGDARAQTLEAAHEIFEQLLFLIDFLCALGVVPKRRIFNLAVDFFQTSFLAVDVKDTP